MAVIEAHPDPTQGSGNPDLLIPIFMLYSFIYILISLLSEHINLN